MKKVTYIALLLVLLQTSAVTLHAQYNDHRNRQVDSLEQVLATHPPTGQELAKIYIQLSWGNLEIDQKKSMDYARKCIETAATHNEWWSVANCYKVVGMHLWAFSQYDSAMIYYGKALDAAERMRDFPKKYTELQVEDALSSIYGNMGNLYNIQGKGVEAIEYYQKALSIFEKYDWKESQAVAYYNIGEMYWDMDNYEQAEINYVKLDSIAHQLDNSLLYSVCQTRIESDIFTW